MSQPLGNQRRNPLKIEWFLFPDTKKDCGRTEVLTVKDFVFSVGEVIFGSLGDV